MASQMVWDSAHMNQRILDCVRFSGITRATLEASPIIKSTEMNACSDFVTNSPIVAALDTFSNVYR
jgi:hypothetical protein